MTSSSCLPTEGNTSAFESPPDMMSSANNNIKPSLAAAAANDDDDDDSPPSRSSDIICLQCNDNDESMPSSSSLVIPDTSAELPSQPLWQQQDEKNSRATTHKEEFIVPMNGSGSSHIAASSSSSSLPTEKLAVKSPRLENSWMRSSPAHASTSTGTTTTTSMMMVDHGQTTIVMAELKEVDDAVIDNDNGGSSGMQQFGESDNNNNNDNRWSSSSSSGIGGGIDDSMSAAEAMLAMASPKSKEATAAMAASSFSSSAALQQQENGTDEGRDDGGGAKTSSAKGEKKSTDLLSQEGEGGGDGRGRVNSRPQHACKTLALVRKNYERIHHMQPASRALASGNTTSSTALPPTALDLSPPPSPNTTTMTSTSTSMIEFLAPQQQSKDGKVDLYQRISVEGNILSHIDSIPSTNGMVGLGLEDENQPNIRYPASFEAMNGMYPTMAAPINVPRGGGGRGHPSLKEKKGKKRGHEKISMNNKESMVAGKGGSEPKNKRSRGDRKSKGKGKGKGKSITFAESASNLAIATDVDVDGGGNKPPPPPSPIRILHPPKNPTSIIRTLPDFTPQPQQYTITTDHRPRRVYNPLLSLPQFPDGSDPPVDQVPQAGELWNISDIHFHDPDTYPISYLASVLGFHVPSVDGCGDQEFAQSFDPMALVRCTEEGEQDVMTIPERGSFCNRVWKGRHHHHLDNNTKQPSCTAMKNDTNVDGPSESAIASCIEYDHGMHDDCKLTYSDPLYTNILSSYRGYNDDDFKDAGKGYLDEISPHCLEFARQRGIFGMNNNNESLSFRFATDVDEEMLTSLAQMVRFECLCLNLFLSLPFCSLISQPRVILSPIIISANGSLIQDTI